MDRPLNVLIVDDESSQRAGLAGMVKAWGMNAETATDGNDALEKLNRYAADVIVTDLNMPGMDGYEFLKTMRDQGDTIPTIVLVPPGETTASVVSPE